MKPDWKSIAAELFFYEGKTIIEISSIIGISVRSISSYFNSLPNYAAEKEKRKQANSNRKDYYKNHKRKSRKRHFNPCGESLKREHITAVKILSRESFFSG